MAILQSVEIIINRLIRNFSNIPDERKELLEIFAKYLSEKVQKEREKNLTFICTHNSRRSHMSQIWAQTSAEYYGIPNIKCYSGGTEATAFNQRAVEAAIKSGFSIEKRDESNNPIYLVYFSQNKEPLKCFSKVYSDPFNPQQNFAAIITCSDADANCPVVLGAEKRFPIKYEDPKDYDDTELEEEKYKERFEQIGTEMLYVFKNVVK